MNQRNTPHLQYSTSGQECSFKENIMYNSMLQDTTIQSKANRYLLLSCFPSGQVP